MALAFSRERARTALLAVMGLVIFVFAIIPVVQSMLQAPRCTAAPMLTAHRSLIQFAIWSSFTHAAIMLVMSFQVPAQRGVLLASAAVTALAGVLLLATVPPARQVSAL